MAEKKGSLDGLMDLSSDSFQNAVFNEVSATSAGATETDTNKEKVPEATQDNSQGANTEPIDHTEGQKNVGTDTREDKNTNPEEEGKEKKNPDGVSTEDKKPKPLEFVVPGEEPSTGVPVENDGWKELAVSQGFEIKEDTFEAYQEGVDGFYRKKHEIDLGKYEPEAQLFFEALNNGLTVDEFLDPTKVHRELKALSDVDIIVKALEERQMPQGLIEKEITSLTERGMIENEAFKLREALTADEKRIQQEIVNSRVAANNRSEQYRQQSAAQELASFKKELDTVSTFMDIPLNNQVREFLVKNLESGKYADFMNSPKMKAVALLYHEFGAQGLESIKQQAIDKAKTEYKQDRHNVPPKTGQPPAQRQGTNTGKEAKGNWDALGNNFTEAYFGV